MLFIVLFGASAGCAIGAVLLPPAILVLANFILIMAVVAAGVMGSAGLGDAFAMGIVGTCSLQASYVCGAILRFALGPTMYRGRRSEAAPVSETAVSIDAGTLRAFVPSPK